MSKEINTNINLEEKIKQLNEYPCPICKQTDGNIMLIVGPVFQERWDIPWDDGECCEDYHLMAYCPKCQWSSGQIRGNTLEDAWWTLEDIWIENPEAWKNQGEFTPFKKIEISYENEDGQMERFI